MKLGDILLSEINQSHKDKYYVMNLHRSLRVVKFTETG